MHVPYLIQAQCQDAPQWVDDTVRFADGLAAAGKLMCYIASQAYCEHNIHQYAREAGPAQGLSEGGPIKRGRICTEFLKLSEQDKEPQAIGCKLFLALCHVAGGREVIVTDGVRSKFDTHAHPVLRKAKDILRADCRQWALGVEALSTSGILVWKSGPNAYVLTNDGDLAKRAVDFGIPSSEVAWMQQARPRNLSRSLKIKESNLSLLVSLS